MKRYIALFLAALIIFAALNGFADAGEEGEFEENSVLVRLKATGGIRLLSSDMFEGLGIAKTENLDITPNGFSLFSESGKETTLKLTLENPGEENVLETVEKLRRMPGVKYASPNYIYRLCDYPDDPYFTSGGQYALEKVCAPETWDLDTDCSDVTIAIVDSGTLITHPDLKDNIWTNLGEIPGDGIDNDENGFTDDVHGWDFSENDNDTDDGVGHGTHVSGIVSAVTNNGIGVASIARNAKIVPLKAFDDAGETKDEYIYKAIQYIAMMGFDISNFSFAGSELNEITREAIAECANTVFVCAAGNNGKNIDSSKMYPASLDLPNIISVANTDSSDKLASTSNYGVKDVDIAAPGTSIISTYKNFEYHTLSGTSMACPMVSSAAAAVKSMNPDMAPESVIMNLEISADPVPALDGKIKTGARLNVYNALRKAAESLPTAEPAPTATSIPTAEPTPEATPIPTASPATTASPVPTATPIPTAEPTHTATPAPTATSIPTAEPTPEATPIPTESPAPTAVPVPTATQIPTAEPTHTATPAPTATSIPTAEPTPEATPIPTASPAPTAVPVPTATPIPTAEPTSEATPIPTTAPATAPPEETEKPTDAPDEKPVEQMPVTVRYDEYEKRLSLMSSDPEIITASVIKAEYDACGRLAGLDIINVSFTEGVSVSEGIEITENDKILVWSGEPYNLSFNIRPLAETFGLKNMQ